MPTIRAYNGGVPFSSLEATDAFVIDRLGVGTGFVEASIVVPVTPLTPGVFGGVSASSQVTVNADGVISGVANIPLGPLAISASGINTFENTDPASQIIVTFKRNGAQGTVNFQRTDDMPIGGGSICELTVQFENTNGSGKLYGGVLNWACLDGTLNAEITELNFSVRGVGTPYLGVTSGNLQIVDASQIGANGTTYTVGDILLMVGTSGSVSSLVPLTLKVLTINGGGGILTAQVQATGLFVTDPAGFTMASVTHANGTASPGTGFTITTPIFGTNSTIPTMRLTMLPSPMLTTANGASLGVNDVKVIEGGAGGVSAAGVFIPGSFTVAQAVALTGVTVGSILTITDADTPTWNATLTGMGSTVCLGQWNGANWTAH